MLQIPAILLLGRRYPIFLRVTLKESNPLRNINIARSSRSNAESESFGKDNAKTDGIGTSSLTTLLAEFVMQYEIVQVKVPGLKSAYYKQIQCSILRLLDFTMNGEIKSKQLRKMSCELSLLSRPDGSANLSCGDTSLMASVYGPAEVKIVKEQINRATVEVIYRPKSGMANCADKLKETLICNTCESVILASLHPRSTVSITIQELQNSGSQLACAINVACLALLDASINMNFMMAAVSCVFTEKGQLILDPVLKEEESAPISMTFVFDSISKDILAIHTTGSYDKEQFSAGLMACRASSGEIFTFYKEMMQKNLSKE